MSSSSGSRSSRNNSINSPSQARRRSVVLPPARPTPTQPVPPTPPSPASGIRPLDHSGRSAGADGQDDADWSRASTSPAADAKKLGPNGTIRVAGGNSTLASTADIDGGTGSGSSSSGGSRTGAAVRPRGATISTVPSTGGRDALGGGPGARANSYTSMGGASGNGSRSANDGRPRRIRPRSLLSNELSLEQHYERLSTNHSRSHSASSVSSSSSSAKAASIMATAASFDHGADSPLATTSTTGTLANSSSPAMYRGSSVEAYSAPPLTSGPSSSAASMISSSAMASAGKPAAVTGETTRSRSGSGTGLLQHLQSRPRSHASFVIAVVGHKGAGKSTVIRKGLRQFGLSRPTPLSDRITSHSTVCIVDQEQRTIEVLEMDASVLLNGPSKRFAWPRSLPYIDAAILCYDASQISSFRGMSELLENFAMNQLSTVMLACKSELNPKAVDPYYASDMASVYNVGLAECSVQSEEGKKRMRDCFSYLVKEVAKSRAAFRAVSSSQHSFQQQQQLHQHHQDHPHSAHPSHLNFGSELTEPVMTYEQSRNGGAGDGSPVNGTQSGDRHPSRRRNDRKMSDVTINSLDGGLVSEEDSALQQSINRAQLGLQSAKSAGGYISIEELFDKFFFAAVSGNDERFLHMFMTFFRGFARPIELLHQIIARFDALSRGEKSDGVMIRYSLMKLTTMLGDWMQEYPGDLSAPETFERLSDFFDQLLHHPATMHVAAPMQPLLDVVRTAPDLDAAWSRDQDNDKPRSVAADVPPVKPFSEQRDRASSTSSSSHTPGPNIKTPSEDGIHILELNRLPNRDRSASDLTGSSDGYVRNQSEGSTRNKSASSLSINAVFGNASQMNVNGNMGVNAGLGSKTNNQTQKAVLRSMSNALFEIREEDIAKELTRIEWDVFCTVGPRDLLRHILVSRKVRATDSPVARSIALFNYVSAWVASSILVQSKVKQRARMLEKFMEVATILRKTNNYNTLHAILAGLTNASIHRLRHTRELVSNKPVMKQYQSLTRLMGSERSFAAYRLALENSEGRTIPYLGVHLQDILSTSDGNPSKRSDGMIHWRKFSLMYDAVMAIVRCQQYQMPLQEDPALSHLILDLPVMDEDELYRRSLHVEARQSSHASSAIGGGGAVGLGGASAGSQIIKQIFSLET